MRGSALSLKNSLPVLALFALAIGFRLLFLGHESLWLDEINTLLVATGHGYPDALVPEPQTALELFNRYLVWQPLAWDALLGMLRQNVHMPLYYLLLNPWLGWVGLSEEAIRGFSLVFSVLMVAVLTGFGHALQSKETTQSDTKPSWLNHAGFWATAFAALSPFQLYYAQEGRMYTLALFFTALAGWALWQILFHRPCKRWYLVHGLALLAGSFTHYVFLFQLPFHAAMILLKRLVIPTARETDEDEKLFHTRDVLFWLTGVILIAALWGWLPVYLDQKAALLTNGDDHFSDGRFGLLRYLGMITWEPLVVVAGSVWFARFFYFPLTVILVTFWLKQAFQKGIKLSTHGFLGLWILVPLLGQIGADWVQHTHTSTVERYAMLIAPAVYLILGLAMAQLPENPLFRRLKMGVLAVMLVIGLGSVWPRDIWPHSPFHPKEKFATGEIAGYLNHELKRGDIIAVNGPLAAPCTLAYYLAPTKPEQAILYWVKTYGRQGNVPKPSPEVFKAYDRVWLFQYRGNKKRGAYELRDQLSQYYPNVTGYLGPHKRLALYEH